MQIKKILRLLLCLTLLASMLAGCGNQETSDPESSTPLASDAPPVSDVPPENSTLPEETDPLSVDHEAIVTALNVDESIKPELVRASQAGFPLDLAEQTTISGSNLVELLDIFIASEAPDKLGEWKELYPALRSDTQPLTRFNAMASIFLATRLAGENYANVNADASTAGSLSIDWNKDYLTWDLYGGFNALPMFDVGHGESYLDGAAYSYFLGRKSYATNEYPFAIDKESNSLRVEDNCTYAEALLAIVRIMDSALDTDQISAIAINHILPDSEFYFMDETQALAPYYTLADERREAILNSPTEIVKSDEFIRGETYTGTAWYISPNGNDENDGRSPETAWKDPRHCNWGIVQPGDAVFFERGGIYRFSEALTVVTDVTYSAYGEGPKPVITGVKENSARPECWELWYEDGTGKKIWKYYEPLGDVAGVVLDDESYADRVLEWPTPDGWLAVDIVTYDAAHGYFKEGNPCALWDPVSAGEYRTVEDNLTEDLTYLSRVSLENFSYPFNLLDDQRTGDLYLRCDKGNPGELYTDIEVISVYMGEGEYEPYGFLINAHDADGYVFDNISIKWYLDNAIMGSNLTTSRDAVIQNCTVEWGGNRLFDIRSAEPECDFSLIGDGIYGVANNTIIRNNYMRHSGNGCTFEANDFWTEEMGDITLGTYLAEGNLMENCGQGIRTYFINPGDINRFDALILRDNIIIDTGTGMNNACWEMPAAIDLGDNAVKFAKAIEVTGNIAIGCESALLRLPDTETVEMNIHDNVFAQYRDRALICEGGPWINGNTTWYLMEDAK